MIILPTDKDFILFFIVTTLACLLSLKIELELSERIKPGMALTQDLLSGIQTFHEPCFLHARPQA